MFLVIHPLYVVLTGFLIWAIWALGNSFRYLEAIRISADKYTFKAKPGFRFYSLVIPALVILLTLFLFAIENQLRYEKAGQEVVFEKREKLPTFSPLRLTPKSVATRYAEDTFQNPQEHLGDSQIVLINGKLERVFPRFPDGGLLYFLNKLSGFVLIETDTLERKVSIEDVTFKYANGIGIFDNLYFQLSLKKYFVEYSKEPIYLKNDKGQWITVVPYITYRGLLLRTPEWGGVMVIDPDGTITDYSPEEAQKISYFEKNRIYPKELAEFYSEAYAYRKGLLNKWFFHEDQSEIVHLPASEKVLHVPTTEGYKQMIVTEPYGKSYGIFKIFFFDATTGKAEIVEYDQKTQLTGPIAAADYVKREFPTYDWNSFILSEPRPILVQDSLYWLLSIIPYDAAGIAGTVLVNAETNEVLRFLTQAELNAFITSGTAPIVPSTPGFSKAQIQERVNSLQRELDQLKQLVR